ncbi:MAG: Gfo/Idh/MocA family oxidoreductase [Gemmatimonadetes bacterium]|nr:Gfo/Idh/MocA family oxidoreductase [Gemmatimonadota bacterium]
MNNRDNHFHLGIAGACGRGRSFRAACDALPRVRVHAVCDIDTGALSATADLLGASEQYADFDEMLEKSDLDGVIIATPMPLHAPQAIAALNRGLHVFSEVPAAVSVEECREIVRAAKSSGGVYMMGENYTYIRENVLIRELVKAGHFGTPYYAEGEYLHELKGYDEHRLAARGLPPGQVWRRHWQSGIDGITYGTHSLGPILQWFDDRVAHVTCYGSGHHYVDAEGRPYAQDTSVMLCKMAKGGLAKIRMDLTSDRPHALTNYQLQGTDGCYESARGPGQDFRIWLRSRCRDENTWMDLHELEEEFLPGEMKAAAAQGAGHGGSDYHELVEFIDAAEGHRTPSIGLHEAMDMTLPGLVSQQSIAGNGQSLPVPDSRAW